MNFCSLHVTLILRNVCYHSVQNILSSRLLSKNLEIKTYKTIILPVLLYGCETWCLALGEVHRLKVFENRVLRRIFGSKREEVAGGWKDCIMRSFISRMLHQTLRIRLAGLVARMEEMRNAYKIFVGKYEGKNHLEDISLGGKILLEWIMGEKCGKVLNGFIWLRIGTSGGLL
jgi:hypothetical protein